MDESILRRHYCCVIPKISETKASPKQQEQQTNKKENGAKNVTQTKRSNYIRPISRELHWLPIERRIDHKLLSLVYSCMDDTTPQYLQKRIPESKITHKELLNHIKSRLLIRT